MCLPALSISNDYFVDPFLRYQFQPKKGKCCKYRDIVLKLVQKQQLLLLLLYYHFKEKTGMEGRGVATSTTSGTGNSCRLRIHLSCRFREPPVRAALGTTCHTSSSRSFCSPTSHCNPSSLPRPAGAPSSQSQLRCTRTRICTTHQFRNG